MPHSVLFEGQNAVFRIPTSHTGFLARIRPVDPHVLGKVWLRAARYTNDQRHRSTLGESILDPVTVEGQNAVFWLPTSHTGVLARIRPVDPRVLGKPGLRAAWFTNDQLYRSTWGESMLDPVTVEDQNAVFLLPTSHIGFWAGIEPVDPHVPRKPGPRAARCTNDQLHWSTLGVICLIQCYLRVKTPHFDGLVHKPTIKSGIRFILDSFYRFWSKRCDFCSVRNLLRSRFFTHWKDLKNLHNWYQFSGAEQVSKLVHYFTEYPPCHGSQTLGPPCHPL